MFVFPGLSISTAQSHSGCLPSFYMLKNYINRQPWFVRRSHGVPQATYIASLGWVGGTLVFSVEAYLRNARRLCGNGSCLNVRTETHLWWKLRSITAESVVSTLAQQAGQDASKFSLCVCFVTQQSSIRHMCYFNKLFCIWDVSLLVKCVALTHSVWGKHVMHTSGNPGNWCKQYLLVSDTLHLIKPVRKIWNNLLWNYYYKLLPSDLA